MTQFKVRRDYSVNNVPVVGYQDSADAQDVLLWGIKQVTQSGVTTDAQGVATVTVKPIVDITHDSKVDGTGVRRERILDSNDITVSGGLYIGDVDGMNGTIKLYIDADKSTSAVNQTGLTITYYTLVPISIDSNGKINAVVSGTVGISGTPNVAVTSMPNVTISSMPNVTISGTPTVSISGTPTVGISGTVPVTVTNPTQVFKKADWNNASGITAGSAFVGNIWTPTTGKKFRLQRVQIFNNHATVDFTGWLKDNTTGCTCDFLVPAKGNVVLEFGNGMLSSAINNVLSMSGYTCSAYTISVMAFGTEE